MRQVIDRLGPLELVLNTPSHHRVHHGRNRYCIDKNYGERATHTRLTSPTPSAEKGRGL